jgi:hypothetical protein
MKTRSSGEVFVEIVVLATLKVASDFVGSVNSTKVVSAGGDGDFGTRAAASVSFVTLGSSDLDGSGSMDVIVSPVGIKLGCSVRCILFPSSVV